MEGSKGVLGKLNCLEQGMGCGSGLKCTFLTESWLVTGLLVRHWHHWDPRSIQEKRLTGLADTRETITTI